MTEHGFLYMIANIKVCQLCLNSKLKLIYDRVVKAVFFRKLVIVCLNQLSIILLVLQVCSGRPGLQAVMQ